MSHGKEAPALPRHIEDEAGETPGWVPALGVSLIVLIGLLLAVRIATKQTEPAPAPAPDSAVAAAPAEGGEAAPAPAEAPAGGH